MTQPGDDYYRKVARKTLDDAKLTDSEVDIDTNARVSRLTDPDFPTGAFVEAWVWVGDPES